MSIQKSENRWCVLVGVAALFVCASVYSQSDAKPLPTNAHPAGISWDCNRGYRVVGAHCVPVAVPANGFLVRAGDDWRCEDGFRRRGEVCAIEN